MSKRDVEPGTGTEEANDADLDETPRPVRKAGGNAFAEMDKTEQAKRKGTRKVK